MIENIRMLIKLNLYRFWLILLINNLKKFEIDKNLRQEYLIFGATRFCKA